MEGLVLSLHSLQKAIDQSIEAIDSRMLCVILRTRLNQVAPPLVTATTHCYHYSHFSLVVLGCDSVASAQCQGPSNGSCAVGYSVGL